jgi:colanic acid biosynthesis glycosyl transferase WcaI
MAKIIVASINFAPDHAGIGVYSTDFPVYLTEQGDDVFMVTGFPYYPQWRKRNEDRGRMLSRESYGGVEVYRGYLYLPSRVSTARRLWHELTFCFFAGLNMMRAGRPAVIIVFTPPFFLGMIGVLAKWFWRRPLVINIQDLPLDAALALGMVKRGLLTSLMMKFEGWIYRQADLVVTISPTMLNNVRAKGVIPEKLLLVPNWIDAAPPSHRPEAGRFISRQPQAKGKFTVAYAGNLGIKQGVDLLLKLAKKTETDPGVHYFVIGDGADKLRLLAIVAELGCSNLTFLPFMNSADYGDMLTDIDMVFVAQRSGAGNNFFPSKLLGLMARSKPLLVAADEDSELARVIREAGCGAVSAYGDVDAMSANLTAIKGSREEMLEMGRRGLEKVQEFDRAKVLGKWRQRIGELLAH